MTNQSQIVTKEKFIAFLKKHKCYRKWAKYTRRNNGCDHLLFLDQVLPSSYIQGAFYWTQANELEQSVTADNDYWNNLHNLWTVELTKLPPQ